MKKLILNVVIILVMLGLVIAVYQWSRPKKSASTTKAATENPAKVYQKKDANGNNHSGYDVSNSIVSAKDARNPSVPLGIVDTSAKLLKIARTQIITITQVASSTKDSLLQAKFVINQLRQKIARYQDEFVDLSYTPDSDVEKPGKFSFSYNNKVTVTQHWQRNKVIGLPLGAKRSFIDVTSNDLRTLINGVKSLSIEQKQPEFGLRLQANTAYSFGDGLFSYGPAVRFDVGRFSIQGRYSKYPNDPKWKPSINASYDILRF
jgi:hypothetical protein